MFDNSKVSDVTVMKPAPRKEGCSFVSMKKNEDKSVSFKFVDATGAELTLREFMPSKVIAGKTLDDDNFKKNVSLTHSRIAHITRAFIPEETFLKIKIEDKGIANFEPMWMDYLKQTAMALGVQADGSVAAAKGKPCALKVVYTLNKGKYYAALPKVPPFISTELHPKEFGTNPQYDIYEIPKIGPDTEMPAPMPMAPVGNEFDSGFGTKTDHPSGF